MNILKPCITKEWKNIINKVLKNNEFFHIHILLELNNQKVKNYK